MLLKILPRSTGRVLGMLALTLIPASSCLAQSGTALKTIQNPGGGTVVYGIFDQESTLQGAMISMLRKVHTNFGERPQIGKFFQTRDGHTVGTFFNVTAKNQGGKPIAGMVMVTMPAGLKPAAAVLFDDAARFNSTEPQLMKALIAAYSGNSNPNSSQSQPNRNTSAQPEAAPDNQAPEHHAPGKPVPAMQRASVGDNSASIDLPPGWRIVNGGGGALEAEGAHGESIHMGIINGNNWDPSTPQGRNMIQYMSRGSTLFTACPFTPDLVEAYQCISHTKRQRMHMPQPTMKVLSVKDMPPNQYEQRVQLVLAEMDFGDGKGPMRASILMGAQRLGPASWSLNVSQVNVPINLADDEWPTVAAMASSYRQNGQVIQAQTDQVIAGINARGAANTARFNQHMKDIDQNSKDFEAHMDGIDRQSKSFQNYTLDQSVLQDNEIPARGTISNATADAYVKANPDRYQIVPQQDWIKGQDY